MSGRHSFGRLLMGRGISLASSEETSRLTHSGTDVSSYGSSATVEEEVSEADTTLSERNNPIGSAESMDEHPSGPYDEAVEDVVTSLARRVRCLFSIITWPIVPLGTTASLALGWLIYASAVLDVGKECSHPLHWYAIMSLILVLYAPYHGRIRSLLFNYHRDRSSERPPGMRRYDQLFHTLALIYVYAGITLVQTCRDDVSVLDPDTDGTGNNSALATNTCAATCPNLFMALRVYVATIEIFTFSLILPLIFLPCLYLYFIRRTMQDAESLAVLQDRFREEEALLRNGGVTEQEIMDQFEKVHLVVDPHGTDDRRILVVPDENRGNLEKAQECSSKECCICMESFTIQEDEEAGDSSGDESLQIIRTKTCGHLFHRRCMASWVSGGWQQSSNSNSSSDGGSRESSRRARRTTCPLCRRDVRPNR